MQKFKLYSVLILGLATTALADDAAVPAVPAEAKVEVTQKAAAIPEETPAKLEAPAKPAKNKEEVQKQAKAEALKKAAENDPDVAARLETPYPLDGEEWREIGRAHV